MLAELGKLGCFKQAEREVEEVTRKGVKQLRAFCGRKVFEEEASVKEGGDRADADGRGSASSGTSVVLSSAANGYGSEGSGCSWSDEGGGA